MLPQSELKTARGRRIAKKTTTFIKGSEKALKAFATI